MELTTDIAGDFKKTSEAILLKIALEGVDYQTARREVLEQKAPTPKAPQQPQPSPSGGTALEVHLTEAEVQATRVTLDITTPDGSLHAELTSVSVHVAHADLAVQAQSKKKDPLVLDLDGSGPHTTGADGAKAFDLAGDGDTRATSFVSGGTAFLALDRNANGRIDDGKELFGDQHGAADGYAELAKFDDNHDGRIDDRDQVFSNLQLLYGDGHTASLASQGVRSLDLGAQAGTTQTRGGDDILGHASATLQDGRTLDTYALGLQRFDQSV